MTGVWWEPYVATWRSHRLLFLVPVVLAVLIAGWSVVGAPKSYTSQVSLWVDNPASEGSSLDALNTQATPPSTQEQTVLDELLSTSQFVLGVADRSTLRSYLASHPRDGFSPSALLSSLGGSHGVSTTQIETELGDNVESVVPGPNVLAISYTGPTPGVAQSTLSALVAELKASSAKYSTVYGQSQADYYRTEYQAAEQAVQSARAQAQEFLAQHPGATGQNNAAYATLLASLSAADNQVGTLGTQVRETQSAASSGSAVVDVIDAPSLPTSATSGKKAQIEGIIGGLFAGIVVSLLAIVLLTKRVVLRERLSGPGRDSQTGSGTGSRRPGAPSRGAGSDPAVRPLQRPVAPRPSRTNDTADADRATGSVQSGSGRPAR